jgi:hypothetical protein
MLVEYSLELAAASSAEQASWAFSSCHVYGSVNRALTLDMVLKHAIQFNQLCIGSELAQVCCPPRLVLVSGHSFGFRASRWACIQGERFPGAVSRQ